MNYIINLLYVLSPTIAILSVIYFLKKENEKDD